MAKSKDVKNESIFKSAAFIMNRLTLLLLPFLVLITSCASFSPKIGMTTEQFDSMCAKSFNGKSIIVSAKNNNEIRRCRNMHDRDYVFEYSRLVSIQSAAIEKPTPTTSSTNKVGNAAFVTAVCSLLSGGQAAACAAGALDTDKSELDRKLRDQEKAISELKRQQALDQMRQQQKEMERENEKRRQELNNWKPGQGYRN